MHLHEIIVFHFRFATNVDDITEIAVRYGGICLRSNSPPCDGKLCMTARIRKVAVHRRYVKSAFFELNFNRIKLFF